MISKDVCHALALSGGGNKGSYEAGAIHTLVKNLPPSEVEWDVITGVSAGAMNTGGISIFKVGNEAEMSEFLVNLWMNMTSDMVWKMWDDGLIHGLFNESGILDDAPLYKFLSNILFTAPAGL